MFPEQVGVAVQAFPLTDWPEGQETQTLPVRILVEGQVEQRPEESRIWRVPQARQDLPEGVAGVLETEVSSDRPVHPSKVHAPPEALW